MVSGSALVLGAAVVVGHLMLARCDQYPTGASFVELEIQMVPVPDEREQLSQASELDLEPG